MSAKTSTRQPSYRLHKPTGQAVVTLNGRDHYLGKHGSTASRHAYDRLLAEWLENGRQLLQGEAITVAGVIKTYWPHVVQHYRRRDGTPTHEIEEIRASLRPLNHLYATTLAAEFGPLKFKAVRGLMVHGYNHPKYGRQGPLCRRVNKRMSRVKRMFRWAVENKLVPLSTYHGLQAVRGLAAGRSEAHEASIVTAVARSIIEETLPILWPTMKDMVLLQPETGMRPGEMVTIRACDIDMAGPIWLYCPPQHKTLHHGHRRTIAIGPKGQEIIRRHLNTDTQTPLFSPRKVMEEKSGCGTFDGN